MEWLAEHVVRRRIAWRIVIAVILVAFAALYQAAHLEHEDDLLAFLPRDNPDVELFNEINKTFGTAEIAIVGLRTDDPFDPSFLRALQSATREIDLLSNVNHVVSLANVPDFTADELRGGIITAPLVDAIPRSASEAAALRSKVMSRDQIVGNLISEDGRAVVIYTYLAYGANPKEVAADVRDIVTRTFPGVETYWGGGPFISTYIYDTTQEDLRRLTPWAVFAIILIMMLVFRDLVGSSVVLLSTAISIVVALGLMYSFGVRFNIVLSAMPVVLFAIGSAYGVHILARYYALSAQQEPARALRAAIVETGPVVVAAGLTTAVSLLSFVCMDIQPLRTFGVFTAAGIVTNLLLAVTFVPAVVRLGGLKHRPSRGEALGRLMGRLSAFAHARRPVFGAALAAIAFAGAFFTARVDTRVDHATFFSAGSPPDRAEDFLRVHFGGSEFVQIHVRGDMNDPHVLREVRRIADRLRLLDDVSQVVHPGVILGQSNAAFAGQPRIPDTAPQVRLLYSFINDPSLSQVVNDARTEAVLHVKLRVSRAEKLQPALQQIEQLVQQELLERYEIASSGSDAGHRRLLRLVDSRIRAVARDYGATVPPEAVSRLPGQLSFVPQQLDPVAVGEAVAAYLRSEENPVPLVDQAVLAVSSAIAAAGPGAGAEELAGVMAAALGTTVDDLAIEDLTLAAGAPVEEIWRAQRARQRREALLAAVGIGVPVGARGERFVAAVETALLDLDNPTALVPPRGPTAAGTISMQVNGLPVMHRGLSRSVTRNQVFSLAFALGLILVILSLMFRSVVTGLLATTPTLLTLLAVYGAMGVLGVRLDIGTSMLASLVLGAGVDYAVHLVAAWRGPTTAEAGRVAAATTGPAIWTNAVMITVGFVVLTLGQAQPLQNVGGLTAAAMMTAALATFLAVPVLARRTAYAFVGHDAPAAQTAPRLAQQSADLEGSARPRE
jgi:predicted RND superfamily exporter protein